MQMVELCLNTYRKISLNWHGMTNTSWLWGLVMDCCICINLILFTRTWYVLIYRFFINGILIFNIQTNYHIDCYIHWNQSSTNILLQEGTAKITDFGLSNTLKQIMSTSKGEGNMAYIDPLSFKDKSYKRGKQSDIFSLGVILWEISSGKIPCEGVTTNYEILLYRLNGSRDSPFPGTSEQYIDLYSKCWDEDPNRRPSSETVNTLLKLLITPSSTYTLDLSKCKIGNTGATVLAKTLESNFSLFSLNLVYDEITCIQAKSILKKALDSNSSITITSINFKWNNIGDTGATA